MIDAKTSLLPNIATRLLTFVNLLYSRGLQIHFSARIFFPPSDYLKIYGPPNPKCLHRNIISFIYPSSDGYLSHCIIYSDCSIPPNPNVIAKLHSIIHMISYYTQSRILLPTASILSQQP